MNQKDQRKGYSLLELSLAVGIMSLIAIVSIAISSMAIERNRLRSVESSVVQAMRRAQKRALHNVDGSQWGVYFCMPSETPECDGVLIPSAIIFKRGSYGALNADDELYETSENITFSGDVYDDTIGGTGLVFDQVTGIPNEPGSFVLTSQNTSTIITVNEKGIVLY